MKYRKAQKTAISGLFLTVSMSFIWYRSVLPLCSLFDFLCGHFPPPLLFHKPFPIL